MGNAFSDSTNIQIFNQVADESLCCFITKDLSFSGIVQEEFRRKFGSVDWLKSQNANVGDIIAVQIGSRYIYYLVVKKNNYSKANIENLRTTIDKVVIHAQTNGITKIAFPNNFYSEISLPVFKNQINEAFAGKNITYVIV